MAAGGDRYGTSSCGKLAQNVQASQGNNNKKKKLMGRMPTDRQGGPKPPFSFTEISQQRSAGKQSPVHPSCQLCSKTIAPRMVLAVCYPARAGRHSSEQQVPVWSQQWFNPSPSARGEQELEPTELLSTTRKTNGATSKSCLPTDTPERSLIVGLIQVLAVREREKHSPGALQDGISALDCPPWAQARCGWGERVVTLAERPVLPPRVQLVLTRSAARGKLTLG